jgi:prophage regulatory protein
MERELPIKLPDDYTLIRLQEVIRMTGLSRSSVYRLIGAGSFPQPVSLTDSQERSAPIGFLLSEVKAWVKQRLEARNGGESPSSV